MPLRISVILGTRPEAIKLAPVVRALRARPDDFIVEIVSTGQHRELVTQALDTFGLTADVQLDAMARAGTLGRLTSTLFADLDALLEASAPDWVVVQGDTTSAMVGAMSAFYRHISVAHVEAGLRTGNLLAPFPEELNRIVVGRVADLHFAPTKRAAENLRREGVAESTIRVPGNTIVDALHWIVATMGVTPPPDLPNAIAPFIAGRRLLLVTSHRRESFGEGLRNICDGLLAIIEAFPDTVAVYPVHPNPNVREPVAERLGNHPRIRLVEPLAYLPLVWLMQHSTLILTDSGGIQEEAPSLGKPVLVLRDTTERQEVVDAGCARLVGADAVAIREAAVSLLTDQAVYDRMAKVTDLFGDGHAAERIAAVLAERSLRE